MIKYHMDNGEIKEAEIKGDIMELTADVSSLYFLISQSLMKDGIAYYAAFKCALMESFDKADDLVMAMTRDVSKDKKKDGKKDGQGIIKDLLEAIFGGDIEKFKEEAKKAKAQAYAEAEGFNDEPNKGDKK